MQQVRRSSIHSYGPLFLEDELFDDKRMVYQYAGEGDAEDNYKYDEDLVPRDNDKISDKERYDEEEEEGENEPSVYKDWNTRFQVCALSSH